MKQNKVHSGPIPLVKDVIRCLNKFKQASDGEAMELYLHSTDADILKVLNTLSVGYTRKQSDAEEPLQQDQVLTFKEFELVEDKDQYKEVLILGNYDRSSK